MMDVAAPRETHLMNLRRGARSDWSCFIPDSRCGWFACSCARTHQNNIFGRRFQAYPEQPVRYVQAGRTLARRKEAERGDGAGAEDHTGFGTSEAVSSDGMAPTL